jgi:signal transduction histidine kinase
MVAHEFNNLLTPVLSYTSYALDTGDGELMQKALEMTLQQVERAKHICDRLLGRPDEQTDHRDTALHDIVEQAIEFLVRELAKDKVTLDIGVPNDIRVRVDPYLIQQVITNLVQNARQAMLGRPGRLTISAETGSAGWVWIHVADTGRGIPPDLQRKVFEPFVTTKGAAPRLDQSGIGLGLALCRELVEDHGGQITFESVEGVGTTFRFSLPAAEQPAASPAD